MEHLSMAELEAGLDEIRRSPAVIGTVELIARRPDVEVRDILDAADLDTEVGVVGDNWSTRGSATTPDGRAHPEAQVTLMNARAIALLARTPDRWALAGDQLYVDFDLSQANLPTGTRLAVGTAVVEVTAKPHTGCQKFSSRFGVDALRFVNSEAGRELRLRGMNARVVQSGTVRLGDTVRKMAE
ncbi:MAG: MOSC domain-containing protein [Actinobacteria bacterium]|nr:MOSC domain-containing protein [Actinomycetota bacterium]